MGQVTYKEIKNLEEVNEYIRQGNEMLGALGFTDHSTEHSLIVATKAGKILQKLNYGKRDIELAKIAGYRMISETASTARITRILARSSQRTF